MINRNMGCIEIVLFGVLLALQAPINRNMGCIEIRVDRRYYIYACSD